MIRASGGSGGGLGVWVYPVGHWSSDRAELAGWIERGCVRRRAGYRGLIKVQRWGKGDRRRGNGELEGRFDGTQVGLCGSVVGESDRVLGQEIFRKSHFWFGGNKK